MNKKRKAAIAACEISEVVTCSLGGYEQKILIEGKSKKNPVVIFIHGGPGASLPFSVGSRGMFPEFTERLILVTWDQLGCGINRFPIDETFTIKIFTDMTIDLIRAVKKKYPENSINLFGASYGSVLAARAAVQVPELLDHVIIYGQVIKNLAVNGDTCRALEQSSIPPKLKLELKRIQNNKNYTPEDMLKIMTWVQKYTEGYVSKTGGKTPIASLLWGMFTSPDYSLKDFKAILFNPYAKNRALMRELANIDITETLKNIQIPYLILQGSKDIVTPTETVSAFMSENQNEKLYFSVVADSAHMPSNTGLSMILENIMNFV